MVSDRKHTTPEIGGTPISVSTVAADVIHRFIAYKSVYDVWLCARGVCAHCVCMRMHAYTVCVRTVSECAHACNDVDDDDDDDHDDDHDDDQNP